MYYIIKIKGKINIPDYVQIRDDQFTLVAYFRTDRPERALTKCGLEHRIDKISSVVEELPFGKIQKIDL
ncbi:MAG: fructose-6-phosphate aldolase [Bacteroidetes bacterium]|nr:fructose-6-phosphate aldolase [Bacteroidota bacterium]